jgi:ABC-type transport system involved in cytochrome bd biosynthesis fused ATPase/permease subunit
MDDGTVVETGPHEDLIAEDGMYADLCGTQIQQHHSDLSNESEQSDVFE